MDPSTRQERLRMRQRGAGTRQINAVDFGISFDPTPGRSARNIPQPASQRRQSRTPLTARGALRRPSRTPSKGPDPANNASSLGQNSVQTSAQLRPDIYDGPLEESETGSRKRRRLSMEQDNAQLITPATSHASTSNLSVNRSTSRRPSSTLPIEIAEVAEQSQHEASGKSPGATAGGSPGANKENTVPGNRPEKTPRSVLSRKISRTGVSSIRSQQSRASRSSSRQSDDVSLLSDAGDVGSGDEVLVAVLEDSDDESLDENTEGMSLMTAQGELPDTTMELVAVLDDTTFNEDGMEHRDVIDPTLLTEGQAETPASRLANIKKKRSSIKTPRQQSGAPRVSPDTLQPSSDTSVQQAQSDLPSPHQAQSTPHAHPASDDSFYQANHEDDDETYLQPTSPAIPTPKTVAKKPARKRKAVTNRRRSSASSSKSSRRKKKSTAFPILTHRLTNTSALPTITEEPDAEHEAENSDTGPGQQQQKSTKFPDRPTPNCVDVLAQFCREDIEAATDNIRSGSTATKNTTAEGPSNTTSRATHKRKRTALQAFASELETRLFTLSTAVEHRLSLEARLKQSAREKSEMQARWVEVRRERERVAVRMDEVRRRKEERGRELNGVRELSEMLFRTELEVERGQRQQQEVGDEGLEWKLRTVAEGVSGRVGGGLLERVREFNGVLERLVGVLDQRGTS
ncbi:hypothetical protein EPUS_07553 [Endocarpon pusillum Z07020]|uniref:Inner kinetochore subunit AME1 domain-containing protein n=1 Tax=Endocarpon pusillum (strain Z07020 / HMAS-L-300199) TaxID=1263415 RepID=U1GKI3_ENDPU|nr:uncharacterized protein EPUS_07553 [Endocarpon pusillum Z07020]ERF72391.1 hypothetical protein EPUS_07553 [Endocarpon pusillum Z07020]